MYFHHPHSVDRVVAEEHLRVGVLLAVAHIVGTAVDLASVLGRHREVIGDVDAVVHHLRLQVLVQQFEVDALAQRLVRCRVEDVVDNLLQHGLLVDVAVADDLLHVAFRRRERTAVVAQDHRFRGQGRLRLEQFRLEGRVGLALVVGGGWLVGCRGGAARRRRLRVRHPFLPVDIIFQITKGLVQLHVAGGLIEGAVDRLVKLFLLHLSHLFDVVELEQKQTKERKSHDYCNGPNCLLLHYLLFRCLRAAESPCAAPWSVLVDAKIRFS